MAPEQIWGIRGTQGPAIDVYALGAVFYETLTGRPPFLAENAIETMHLVRGKSRFRRDVGSPRRPAIWKRSV